MFKSKKNEFFKMIKVFKLSTLFFLCLSMQGQGFEKKDIVLPELGDRVSGAVSSDQEKAIGNEFLKQIFAQAKTISDPLIYEYTELLIYRLSEYSQVQDRYFNIILIDDSSLNAFAAPGGIIGVNGGLFLNADNEGQFASVLSHELAHLSQRHFARNVLKSQDSNLASALLLVSSIAAARGAISSDEKLKTEARSISTVSPRSKSSDSNSFGIMVLRPFAEILIHH